jgi:hypothetical protein
MNISCGEKLKREIKDPDKMFVLIHPSQLIENKKYKIVSSKTDFIGIYKCKNYFEENDYVTVYELFVCFTKDTVRCIHFSPDCSFYEMVPRAQAKMERRAVNLIVRRLIGDDCFEW